MRVASRETEERDVTGILPVRCLLQSPAVPTGCLAQRQLTLATSTFLCPSSSHAVQFVVEGGRWAWNGLEHITRRIRSTWLGIGLDRL